MREQPEQQAPPVQRLRVRYAKRGRLRFSSHRDFSRAFERALVRASIPMAYSSGFNPHPRISYAGAAPTGSSSEAEYLEIGLATVSDPADIAARLDESLPPGLDVVEVVVSAGGGLADRLEASCWRIELPGTPSAGLAAAVEWFLAASEVNVERMTKRGLRTFDCRAAVTSLTVVEPGERVGESAGEPAGEVGRDAASESDIRPAEAECAILQVVLRHGTPSVRPDDVLAGLREFSGFEVGAAALFGRLAQGPWDEETGTVGDPLQADRDAM